MPERNQDSLFVHMRGDDKRKVEKAANLEHRSMSQLVRLIIMPQIEEKLREHGIDPDTLEPADATQAA